MAATERAEKRPGTSGQTSQGGKQIERKLKLEVKEMARVAGNGGPSNPLGDTAQYIRGEIVVWESTVPHFLLGEN
ncbi:hypothetical protein RRG08_033463 [Elysia crispata]|uniref:Uncharacterized protein n=1 Tax=Elysia crispata TaxID=231223 RepID=A0AAE1AUY9_9GAST|nr:hypothetical protein RRG08_033463 [Elysia crispata]